MFQRGVLQWCVVVLRGVVLRGVVRCGVWTWSTWHLRSDTRDRLLERPAYICACAKALVQMTIILGIFAPNFKKKRKGKKPRHQSQSSGNVLADARTDGQRGCDDSKKRTLAIFSTPATTLRSKNLRSAWD